jgi:hypothetical protein
VADELGPGAQVPPTLVLGDLPQRLVDLMLVYAETMRAAGPWLTGDVAVPLAQLREMGEQLRALEAATEAAIAEAHDVYRATERRRTEAQAVLGGAA